MIEQMKELGIFGLAIPEELGGTKVSMPCYVHITEELARGWMSLAGAMGGHTVVSKLIVVFGTDEQKARYLPRHGDRRGARHDGAHGTRRRLGPAGHEDRRRPRRRPLRRQRLQDLDHERPTLRAHRVDVQDRSGGVTTPSRHQHPPRRARARTHRVEGPAQARVQGRRELRADLRGLPRPGHGAARRPARAAGSRR